MGNVYFVCTTDAVKVGFTTSWEKRRPALQTGSADKLQLLALLPNVEKSTEKALHEAFKMGHINGEWFRKTSRLLRFADLVHQGSRPTTPAHIATLLAYIDASRADRVNKKPPTVIPEKIRGTANEKLIMDLDTLTRTPDVPQMVLAHAHRSLRRALRGQEVDLGQAAAYLPP